MARKYPLVLVDGTPRQLPPDDTLASYNIGQLTAASGIVGGGDLSTGTKRVDAALATNASGVIFVNDSIGLDGADLVTASTAQASGNAALQAASVALVSGASAQAAANRALASGNAALTDIQNYVSRTSFQFTAGSQIPRGGPVGLDDAGRAQLVRYARGNSGLELTSNSSFNNLPNTTYVDAQYIPQLGLYGFTYRSSSTSNYPSFVLAQPSGNTLQYGSPTIVASAATGDTAFNYNPVAGKIVYAYGTSNTLRCALGTVSGLTSTFAGDILAANATVTNTWPVHVIYDSRAQVSSLWYSFFDGGSTYYGYSIPLTNISGNTITLGAASTYFNASSYAVSNTAVVYNPTQGQALVAYQNTGTGASFVRTATYGAGTYSYGTQTSTGALYVNNLCYVPREDRVVLTASDYVTGIYAVPIATSGSTSTLYTGSFIGPYGPTYTDCVYDSGNNRILIAYQDTSDGSYRGTVSEAVLSGNVILTNSNKYPYSASSTYISLAPDVPSGQSLLAHVDAGVNNSGIAYLMQGANLVYPTIQGRQNYIGTAQATAASGSTVRVLLPVATDLNQTNLTPGYFYYVNPNTSGYTASSGTPYYSVGTSNFTTWSGIDGWGYVGKAITSSGLLMLRSIQ